MGEKSELLVCGTELMQSFCDRNALPATAVDVVPSREWRFVECAYYRKGTTTICVERCANVGTVGRQWSYPGYTVDRTPYGVLQHELGHHVDVLRSTRKGNYYGDFSLRLREQTGEKPVTTYCPNDAEWFAEIFRVFVTNPDLLRLIRPRTYRELRSVLVPVFDDTWQERLRGAPARTIAATERKIEEVRE